jgi:hypothetical protein
MAFSNTSASTALNQNEKNNFTRISHYDPRILNSIMSDTIESMTTWYGVQICLLHPEIRTVFSDPVKVSVSDNKKVKKGGMRKIKYIKIHRITDEDMDEVLRPNRTYNRHSMAWYVIGHHRTCHSGKKIFIQGYWKGALRDIKKNQDAGRERIIDVEETTEEE